MTRPHPTAAERAAVTVVCEFCDAPRGHWCANHLDPRTPADRLHKLRYQAAGQTYPARTWAAHIDDNVRDALRVGCGYCHATAGQWCRNHLDPRFDAQAIHKARYQAARRTA